MARIHTFEDAMMQFDELLESLDVNIRGEVLEEIAERATTAMGEAARTRLAGALDEDDEDDDDDDFEDDDDGDWDDDDVEDDDGEPS